MKIYIAGPYQAHQVTNHDAVRVSCQNVQRAIEMGVKLIEKGHNPYIPHFSHFLHINMDHDIEKHWSDLDLEWLRCCDAILLLPTWETSEGAWVELREAQRLKLKVFYHLWEVPNI